MDSDPQVAIVVPTCRRPDLLRRALDSVRIQSEGRFECLVVNDDPGDREAVDAVVAAIGDPRMRVAHNAENRGANHCRNRGIMETSAPVVAFLDDDDEWLPEKLERHLDEHHRAATPVLVYSGFLVRWDGSRGKGRRKPAVPPPLEITRVMGKGKFCPRSTSGVTVDRRCFSQAGLFDESLPSLQDWDMWFRIARNCDFRHIRDCLNIFHHHASDRVSTNWQTRIAAVDAIENKYAGDPHFSPASFRREILAAALELNLAGLKNRGRRLGGVQMLRENRKMLLCDVGLPKVLRSSVHLLLPRS